MTMTLLREFVGSALRVARQDQSRSLRDVAKSARVSLGYLSEVERGQKEASSEMLNSICSALNLNLIDVMKSVLTELEAAQAPTPLLLLTKEDKALQIDEAA